MLANLYIVDAPRTVIKFYKGDEIIEKTFNKFDEAINSMVLDGFKMKAITEDDTVGMYSYWFEK